MHVEQLGDHGGVDSCRSGLESVVHAVYRQCSRTGLSVNYDKSNAMCFRKSKRALIDEDVLADGMRISFVASFKYLEIIFKHDGTFGIHVSELAKRGISCVGRLCAKWRRFPAISPRLQFMTVDSLFLLTVLFGCEL